MGTNEPSYDKELPNISSRLRYIEVRSHIIYITETGGEECSSLCHSRFVSFNNYGYIEVRYIDVLVCV